MGGYKMSLFPRRDFQWVVILLLATCFAGCQTSKNIDTMNYSDYMKIIKEGTFDDFSILLRGSAIKDIHDAHNWKYSITNSNCATTEKNVDQAIKILLSDSAFIGRLNDDAVAECGFRASINLYNRETNENINILATDVGFSFDGYAPAMNRLFLNDKLLDWLIKQLEDAGLPETAANINKYCPRKNKNKE